MPSANRPHHPPPNRLRRRLLSPRIAVGRILLTLVGLGCPHSVYHAMANAFLAVLKTDEAGKPASPKASAIPTP